MDFSQTQFHTIVGGQIDFAVPLIVAVTSTTYFVLPSSYLQESDTISQVWNFWYSDKLPLKSNDAQHQLAITVAASTMLSA